MHMCSSVVLFLTVHSFFMIFLLMAWSHIFTFVVQIIILCAELECGSMEKLKNYIKLVLVLCIQKICIQLQLH